MRYQYLYRTTHELLLLLLLLLLPLLSSFSLLLLLSSFSLSSSSLFIIVVVVVVAAVIVAMGDQIWSPCCTHDRKAEIMNFRDNPFARNFTERETISLLVTQDGRREEEEHAEGGAGGQGNAGHRRASVRGDSGCAS